MTVADVNNLELFCEAGKPGQYTLLRFKDPAEKVIIYDPGLYHTAICDGELCQIDKETGYLYYRKTLVTDLLDKSFVEVASWILFGNDKKRAQHFESATKKYFVLIPEQKRLLDHLDLSMHPMHVLSIASTALENVEEKYLGKNASIEEKAAFLFCQIAVTVTYRHTLIHQTIWKDQHIGSHAEKIIGMMRQDANPEKQSHLASILNTIMILHAEHGLNCSAAAVRTVTSARTSLYTAVASGMHAFNGDIHGGASQRVSEMYDELSSTSRIQEYVDDRLEKKQLLMGFGQRTYNRIPNCWDPRVEKMHQILLSKELDYEEIRDQKRVAIELIDYVMQLDSIKSKNLTPNPDLFNCIFFKLFGAKKEMNTTMLALGRIIGWIANYIDHSEKEYPLTRPSDVMF